MFNFFKKFPIGLDISDFSIEVLELKRKFGKIYLRAYGRVNLEKGIVKDGEILNKEKLKERFKELLASTLPRRLKTNQVIFCLPELKTFFHIFRLPVDLQRSELTNALESEAQKIIPLEPVNIYFDFQTISKTKNIQEILYVATPKKVVNQYLEVLKEIGLKPIVLEIESASLARAFKNEMIEDGGVIIADIGTRTTTLTIYDEGVIRLSATIPMGGNHFTQAISEKLNISLEKAEELKRSSGFDPEKEKGKIMLILQNLLQEILGEIKKSISFYEEKRRRKIKKILLCGGSSFLPKLPSYISANLGLESLVPDPWKGIDVEELFQKKEFRKIITTKLHPVFFASVIGLAKRGLEKNPERAGINLIPKTKK